MQCFIQALDSCACKAIFGHWSCHAKSRLERHMHIKLTKIIYVHVHCWSLKHMMTYERVKSKTRGSVTNTYFELKMIYLFCLRK